MKSNKLSILCLSGCLILITSCVNDLVADWKHQNDSYFTNMKDSTGYVLYNIPASRGGSSFYYKVTSAGDPSSVSPLYTDRVVVNYRGKVITGTVFDQNYIGAVAPRDSTATPGTFVLNQLVPGWIENLMQMKVGETRSIVLPQELGYGAEGAGYVIKPYSTTVWNVQLVKGNP